MLQKIFDKFSGGQLTAIIITAILVPGALGAAVAYQAVAIVDPNTGAKSYIDNGRKLWVLDYYTRIRNDPANLVEISMPAPINNACQSYQYTIPTGKALVLTSVTGNSYPPYTGTTAIILYDGANCGGSRIANLFRYAPAGGQSLQIDMNFGSGLPVAAGKTISLYATNDVGYHFLHGYLVPASSVPTAASEDHPAPPTPLIAPPSLRDSASRAQ